MDHPLCSASAELLDCCLVVEDDSIIRIDLEFTLRTFGLKEVLVASTVEAATRIAETAMLRFAILDFEVGRSNTIPVAEVLTARGIPVMFLTAYDTGVELPARLSHLPILAKPFTSALLAEALLKTLERLQARTGSAAALMI